ncbi:cell division protein FtsI/penicillin-binding protein 2 [Geomicrobium halophilum]|uniref:Cell division protein FtsI/penicillin-binding protein 2 n=1 Tax=Geomicrobium halophilum TaxID=549000 RepID=A0A841PJB9_9BACL|nr:penicillin-binding protein 2 [Geomicrobium halophilum]MBB6448870.1 cell division protein FtsI/penicillin-binding protein 2 [Geomicrobium halophilum]
MVREKRKNHIPFRLNVLFFAVFALFSILILRLGFIQIVEGDEYESMLNDEGEQTATVDAPRGLMLDRNGNTVVDNELQLSLTYTNRPGNEEERIAIADRLSSFLDITEDDIDDITEREWQDYWLQTREDEAEQLVSEQEQAELEDEEVYQLQLDMLSQDEIMADMDEDEMEAVAIWTEMLSGYNYSPNRIAEIEEETAHAIGELLHELPGTDIMRDSVRFYPYGESFSRFLGQTGSIPSENLEQYIGEGYERSDTIGTTFLENEYEDVLRGEKAEMTTDADGNETMDPGKRGNDLVLTIDMALQQELDSIIQGVIDGASGDTFLDDREAYVVMMEPDTGEILSMASYGDHLGTVTNAFEIGSTIKPATVLAGYTHDVIDHGSTYNDRPLTFPGDARSVSSWRNMGTVDDIDAIRMSSNIYMAGIAMEMADYEYGASGTDWSGASTAYRMLRNHYRQFGLGTETGIDLPFEMTGIEGTENPENLLFMSFGQFDTYTPLQMAQYTATLANDGDRIKPKLVKEIREPATGSEETGAVVRQFTPEVLNSVNNTTADFDRMHEGMRQVMQTPGSNGTGGTAYSDFSGADYSPAGKTGTAQVTVNGQNGNNQAMIAYAPHDDPEVAIAVIVPNLSTGDNASGLANNITRQSLDAYFEMQEGQPEPEEVKDEDEMYQDQQGDEEEEIDMEG